MKLQFKHTAVLPYVDRVLREISRAHPELAGRFPRPIDEIITFCYPLAIVEVAALDARRARVEMAKLFGGATASAGSDQKLAGCLFVKANDGVVLVESTSIAERKGFTKAHELGADKLPRASIRGICSDFATLVADEIVSGRHPGIAAQLAIYAREGRSTELLNVLNNLVIAAAMEDLGGSPMR